MSAILVQLPTLGRKKQLLEILELAMSRLSGKHEVVFNINCDASDLTMNNDKTRAAITDLFWSVHKNTDIGPFKPSYDLHFDRDTTKISSMNAHINPDIPDIIMGMSDDMVPKHDNWDDIIVTDMLREYPDLDGCISYSDGRDVGSLVTLSILGRNLYKRFNYIYHPDYAALYCDNEFTDVVTSLGKISYLPTMLFEHEHYAEKGNRNSGNLD